MSRKGLVYAIAMTALLGVYVWLVGSRAITLISTGTLVGVGIGVAAFAIPIVTVWFVWKEWRQAHAVSAMYSALAQQEELVVDDLPRSPTGKVDKEAALDEFPTFANKVESSPDDWRAWFNLGWAYDAAGDRRRAREALGKAAQLFRSSS